MIIKVHRKYLNIKSIKEIKPKSKPNKNCYVHLLDPPDFQINKFFYKQIGKYHRWFDRLEWDNQKWISYLENPNVKTYILKEKQNFVGYYEIIFNSELKNCEIAYLGILKEYFGKKYGGFLVSEAIKNSFKMESKNVWLHTCSLDHKNALKNYLARGMKIFKTETINLNIN